MTFDAMRTAYAMCSAPATPYHALSSAMHRSPWVSAGHNEQLASVLGLGPLHAGAPTPRLLRNMTSENGRTRTAAGAQVRRGPGPPRFARARSR
jgi:hypothetical protein